MPDTSPQALGVFDSGVGGLTVLHRLMERLPQEPIFYLGDTARIPYGTKSPATVTRYAGACADILRKRGIKLLVVACNTASAVALDALRDELEIPVLGVVEPGAQHAVDTTRNGRIGVIGTAGTIGSAAYQDAIRSLAPDAEVFCRVCPLFVPLAEEGWTTGAVPEAVARTYLEDLMAHDIDTLVLGCTHYPLLTDTISAVVGASVKIVDSASATSAVVAETLTALGEEASPGEVRYHFMVTDDPESFSEVGEHFLGCPVTGVEWVDVR
jgi:glutamate racemase